MDGILIINKPKGLTSHDVVDFVRRKFNVRRVGHTGTLDSMAEGVLVVLIGKATKLSDKFLQQDKEYIAKLFFGKSTDTQDATGKVLEEKKVDGVDLERIKTAFKNFLGEIDQVPPMVSAIKQDGRKLYELARAGINVPRHPRKIVIKDLELIEYHLPELTFRVRCSKGAYIRTLCEDIGRFLSQPAHMSGLLRIRAGEFLLKDAKRLNDISEEDIRPIL